MPVHDWSQVAHSMFHDFHCSWIIHLKEQLNRVLPADYYAMAEQHFGTGIGDVVTLTVGEDGEADYPACSACATMTVSSSVRTAVRIADLPPQVSRHLFLDDAPDCADRARQIIVRTQRDHRVVAIVEIVSTGNKNNRYRLQSFVEKASQAIRRGIHVLMIDLLPPGELDPQGLHNEIWQALGSTHIEFQPERPLTLASYFARPESPEAFIEPTAVGQTLAKMPLFLDSDCYIEVPLEESYQEAWQGMPTALRPANNVSDSLATGR